MRCLYICIYIYSYVCFCGCKTGRWFLGCPAYQSGPGKDGFRIDVSMTSQSSFSRSLLAASRYAGHPRNHRHIYIYIYIYIYIILYNLQTSHWHLYISATDFTMPCIPLQRFLRELRSKLLLGPQWVTWMLSLILGNKTKSTGARSGLYSGFGTVATLVFSRSSWNHSHVYHPDAQLIRGDVMLHVYNQIGWVLLRTWSPNVFTRILILVVLSYILE